MKGLRLGLWLGLGLALVLVLVLVLVLEMLLVLMFGLGLELGLVGAGLGWGLGRMMVSALVLVPVRTFVSIFMFTFVCFFATFALLLVRIFSLVDDTIRPYFSFSSRCLSGLFNRTQSQRHSIIACSYTLLQGMVACEGCRCSHFSVILSLCLLSIACDFKLEPVCTVFVESWMQVHT
jgi:hypothetical protein